MKFIDNFKNSLNEDPKKKQKVIIVAIVGGFFIVAALFLWLFPGPKVNVKKNIIKPNIINTKKFTKEQYLKNSAVQNEQTKKQIAELKEQNTKLTKEFKNVLKMAKKKSHRKEKTTIPQAGFKKGVYPPVPVFNRGIQSQPTGGAPQIPQQKVSVTVLSNPINTILNSEPPKKNKKHKKKITKTFYIPAGEIIQGTLLNGMDAPTSAQAKSNPYPALITIRNLSFLPNAYRMNIKGCFVLASGYGELSDNRVNLRTNTLSCIADNGRYHIDAAIHAFIVGHHGKIGLRGKVVTKQGAILARELFAGFFQGIGTVAQEDSMTTSVSPLGQTSAINPSRIVTAGLGQGISSAADSLSKFYLKMANDMFPVIEIGPGRPVTIVISKATRVIFKKNSGSNKKNVPSQIKK